MSLTSRDRKLLTLVAVLAILGGYWFVLIKPKRAEVGELETKIAAIEATLSNTRQQIALSSSARSSYPADYSAVIRLGQAIPRDEAMPSLLVQLDALTGKGLEFTQAGVEKYPQSLLGPSFAGEQSSTPTAPVAGSTTTPVAGGAPPVAGSTTTPTGGATPSSGAAPPSTGEKPSTTTPEAPSPGGTEGAQPGLPFQPVEVRLQFQGDFFKLHRLFAGMDRLVRVTGNQVKVGGRLIFIEGFKVKESRKGFPHVAINVGAIVFSLPDGESISGGASPEAPPQGGPQPVSSSQSGPSAEAGSGTSPAGVTPAATSTPSAQ